MLSDGRRLFFTFNHRSPSIQWLLATLSCGTALGLLLQKLQVFEANRMQQQLLFENFILMKTFFSAVVSGIFVCSILSMLPHTNQMLRATMAWYPLNFENRSYTSCALGGTLLGSGMALSGACPTTLFVQLGSGVPNAVWVLAGGYCATVTFDILRPVISNCLFRRKCLVPFYLHRWMMTPYFNVSLPIAVILATATFSLELWKPKESHPVLVQELQPTPVAWSPYIVGILISLLHLSLIGIFYRFITNSDVFTIVNDSFLYLLKNRRLPANIFPIFFNLGVTLGAYLSSFFSSQPAVWEIPSWYQSFFGGMSVFFGSKLAAGCSVGHGVSGMMALSKLSLFVFPFFWLGGFFMASFLTDTI